MTSEAQELARVNHGNMLINRKEAVDRGMTQMGKSRTKLENGRIQSRRAKANLWWKEETFPTEMLR